MTSELTPRCPKCDAGMTPRRNKQDGNLFWGCTKYNPTSGCKGTRNIERDSASYLAASDLRGHMPDTKRVLYRSRGWLGEDFPSEVGVWALESYPHTPIKKHEPTQAAFLSTLWKHHTRGSRVLLDPQVDVHLKQNRQSLNASFENIRTRAFSFRDWQFSRMESFEKDFFSELLKENPAAESYVCPQFPLSALTPLPINRRMRGDFLIRTRKGLKLIEIDGAQHSTKAEQINDAYRDMALNAAGIETVRVSTKALRAGATLVAKLFPSTGPSLTPEQFCHLISVALFEGMRSGWINPGNKTARLVIISPHVDEDLLQTANVAVAGALRHITALASLYGIGEFVLNHATVRVVASRNSGAVGEEDVDIFLSLGDWPVGIKSRQVLVYRDLRVDVDVRLEPPPCKTVALSPTEDICAYFLNLFFRHARGFKEGQYAGVARVLRGQDALVLLPTGKGKSVVYQLASLLRPGTCLYISPLLSLMDDQRHNISTRGIDNIAVINSELTPEERSGRQTALAWGQFTFCFISPERMQIPEFRTAIQDLAGITPISCAAIDEVHCVSEWGHNFRVAYLNLGANCRAFARNSADAAPPLLGLTGTASRAVLSDVKRDLDIPNIDAIITPQSFDRKELEFQIIHCDTSDKHHRIKDVLEGLPAQFGLSADQFYSSRGKDTSSGIIFCPHVNGEHGLLDMRRAVAQTIGEGQAAIYSGKMPDGLSSQEWRSIKKDNSARFRGNSFPVMVATKAYGMGIDKPNVRYTIHYGLPASIEDFYQEAGRAGRDEERAICTVISSLEGYQDTSQLLDPQLGINAVRERYDGIRAVADNDISRNIFFLLGSFEGEDADLNEIEKILTDWKGEIEVKTKHFSWALTAELLRKLPEKKQARAQDENRERISKAAHRLKLIGCISDYQLDYQKCLIEATFATFDPAVMRHALLSYVGNFQRTRALGMQDQLPQFQDDPKGYALKLARVLVDFVYEVIEKSRRAAISEMSQACGEGATNDTLRMRILAYLNPSPFDDRLLRISEAPSNTNAYEDVFDELMGSVQVESLRGSTARMLTDFPDAPGLLILRGVAETLAKDGNIATAADAVLAGWASGSKHAMSNDDLTNTTGAVLARLSELNLEAKCRLLTTCLRRSTDFNLIKRLSPFAKRREEHIALIEALARTGLADAPKIYERMRELSR